MNFLAHTALVGPSDGLRLGGLLGDFVKSTLLETPAGMSREMILGIRLHRNIDSYLDAHLIFQRSRRRVSDRYRRAAGIMVDVFYDHFLAKHWTQFYDESLEIFAARIYDLLDRHAAILPPRLEQIRHPMRVHDWLVSYRDLHSIHTTVDRMAGRLSRPELLRGGAVELEAAYAGFEEDFFLIYAALQAYVAEWLQINIVEHI